MKLAGLLVLILALECVSGGRFKAPSKEDRKQLAGPPAEFKTMATPSPDANGLTGNSALIPVNLDPSRNGQEWSWSGSYPIDSDDEFTMSILSPYSKDLHIFLQPPNWDTMKELTDAMFEGSLAIGKKSEGSLGIDGASASSVSYTFFDPPAGTWQILIQTDKDVSDHNNPGLPEGYLLLDNKSPYEMYAHLTSYDLDEGEEIGVAVRMTDTRVATASKPPMALTNVIFKAELDFILPDGNEVVVPMHDDGLHADFEANDGIYGATIEAAETGTYVARSVVSGTNPDGLPFIRTSQHLLQVTPIELTLTGLAKMTYPTKTKVQFLVDVDYLTDKPTTETVRAYAEVWGSTQDGLNYLPIAWVSAMVDPVVTSTDEYALSLDLNTQWIELAGAYPPFQLRNVLLQDRDTNTILSQRAAIYVDTTQDASVAPRLTELANRANLNKMTGKKVVTITDEMRHGPRPAWLSKTVEQKRMTMSNSTLGASTGKLLLVHGYCSGPVWSGDAFTDAVVFEDYSQSRSNDEFALLIKALGDQYGSFGIVAHSQGGLASLHLKTYYWSGLDVAESLGTGRLIQSVGSPYSGCSLSGLLADIGWLFGFGCGSNFDLSPDGGSLWLSKIPVESEDAVYYYTTRYEQGWWIFGDCVTASNLVLEKPNDGTCELNKASLPGGHDMGTKEGWCHTSDMKFPPQCSDPERNAEMNANAAR